MNEILAPIVYVCGTGKGETSGGSDSDTGSTQELGMSEDREADAFWCFTCLMSEVRDWFMKPLDGTESGIKGLLEVMLRWV